LILIVERENPADVRKSDNQNRLSERSRGSS